MGNRFFRLVSFLGFVFLMVSTAVFADEAAYQPAMYSTFWALVPPVVAIVLALLTKEVFSSLFIGILVGGLFYSGFTFEGTMTHILQGGFVTVLADAYNVGILIFLVILGGMVCLMNAAGGSRAFGQWASKRIKTRVGAQLATILLGCLIFVDDYFNCLTVGSVMRPVTDKHNVLRAPEERDGGKLADAVACAEGPALGDGRVPARGDGGAERLPELGAA